MFVYVTQNIYRVQVYLFASGLLFATTVLAFGEDHAVNELERSCYLSAEVQIAPEVEKAAVAQAEELLALAASEERPCTVDEIQAAFAAMIGTNLPDQTMKVAMISTPSGSRCDLTDTTYKGQHELRYDLVQYRVDSLNIEVRSDSKFIPLTLWPHVPSDEPFALPCTTPQSLHISEKPDETQLISSDLRQFTDQVEADGVHRTRTFVVTPRGTLITKYRSQFSAGEYQYVFGGHGQLPQYPTLPSHVLQRYTSAADGKSRVTLYVISEVRIGETGLHELLEPTVGYGIDPTAQPIVSISDQRGGPVDFTVGFKIAEPTLLSAVLLQAENKVEKTPASTTVVPSPSLRKSGFANVALVIVGLTSVVIAVLIVRRLRG